MKIGIIGAGPGGYEAAIYAAKRGAEVVLIEKDEVGGTCLNRGCIPTKSLLNSVGVFDACKQAHKFGVNIEGDVTIDFESIMKKKKDTVDLMVKGIHFLIEKLGIRYVKGFGSLIAKDTIKVIKENGEKEEIKCEKIILASGSVAKTPKELKYDGKRVISSDEVLEMEKAPESIIIAGASIVGCELGQILARAGTKVTIVGSPRRAHILPYEDEDVAKQLARQFKKEKIKVYVKQPIEKVNVNRKSVEVTLGNGDVLEAEYFLVTVGRKANSLGLGLEDIGLLVNPSFQVMVDDYMRTSINGISAIGDLLNTDQLAHVATKEGIVAVKAIFGEFEKVNYNAVPRCTYTFPEIAAVGYTEKDLIAKGVEYKVGTFDFRALGKAQASGHTTGFVKIIVDSKDVIIGASIVGHNATDMINVLTMAIQSKMTSEEAGRIIFPHPTLGEAIMEALHDVHGMSIHKL